jgi:hypothetical protein
MMMSKPDEEEIRKMPIILVSEPKLPQYMPLHMTLNELE